MKIGFIGLGAMGRPMAGNLQRAGHALQVFDLRRVMGCESLELIERCRLRPMGVFTMLRFRKAGGTGAAA